MEGIIRLTAALQADEDHCPAPPVPSQDQSRAGALDDLEAVVRQHQARIERLVAFAVRDQDLADSIVQDCFLKAYRTRHQFRGECSISSWLTRIAFNLIKDATRTRRFRFWQAADRKRVELDEATAWLANGERSAEAVLLARERIRQVQDVLSVLSEKQRAVFVMRFVEDMEIEEIAAATGIRPATVRTHLLRVVAKLRARIAAAAAEPAARSTR